MDGSIDGKRGEKRQKKKQSVVGDQEVKDWSEIHPTSQRRLRKQKERKQPEHDEDKRKSGLESLPIRQHQANEQTPNMVKNRLCVFFIAQQCPSTEQRASRCKRQCGEKGKSIESTMSGPHEDVTPLTRHVKRSEAVQPSGSTRSTSAPLLPNLLSDPSAAFLRVSTESRARPILILSQQKLQSTCPILKLSRGREWEEDGQGTNSSERWIVEGLIRRSLERRDPSPIDQAVWMINLNGAVAFKRRLFGNMWVCIKKLSFLVLSFAVAVAERGWLWQSQSEGGWCVSINKLSFLVLSFGVAVAERGWLWQSQSEGGWCVSINKLSFHFR
ncbi:hypothetical protein BLNAU_11087 [Blattamonas nauphoetae]|uniref:Uncharacterized protein n=1 Tax=Blattamonas nauphoetae TaxID=2049346 RepID=A0ABQ9XRL0_9EUKA|nr:hypothetical protein BLNAU_11087 [Blattamonas nauphoetae]